MGNDNVLHAVGLHRGVHGYLQADEDEGAEAENYRKRGRIGINQLPVSAARWKRVHRYVLQLLLIGESYQNSITTEAREK